MTKPYRARNTKPGHPRAEWPQQAEKTTSAPHLGEGWHRHTALALEEPPGQNECSSERKDNLEPCPNEAHGALASPRLADALLHEELGHLALGGSPGEQGLPLCQAAGHTRASLTPRTVPPPTRGCSPIKTCFPVSTLFPSPP